MSNKTVSNDNDGESQNSQEQVLEQQQPNAGSSVGDAASAWGAMEDEPLIHKPVHEVLGTPSVPPLPNVQAPELPSALDSSLETQSTPIVPVVGSAQKSTFIDKAKRVWNDWQASKDPMERLPANEMPDQQEQEKKHESKSSTPSAGPLPNFVVGPLQKAVEFKTKTMHSHGYKKAEGMKSLKITGNLAGLATGIALLGVGSGVITGVALPVVAGVLVSKAMQLGLRKYVGSVIEQATEKGYAQEHRNAQIKAGLIPKEELTTLERVQRQLHDHKEDKKQKKVQDAVEQTVSTAPAPAPAVALPQMSSGVLPELPQVASKLPASEAQLPSASTPLPQLDEAMLDKQLEQHRQHSAKAQPVGLNWDNQKHMRGMRESQSTELTSSSQTQTFKNSPVEFAQLFSKLQNNVDAQSAGSTVVAPTSSTSAPSMSAMRPGK